MTLADEREDQLVRDQIEYYRQRAGEYDQWFMRQGRYDRGEVLNRQWWVEVEQLTEALEAFGPRGRVVEFACGTGWWTQQLARHADEVTAVDASAEVMEINRRRVGPAGAGKVRYVQADIFAWRPQQRFDVAFFSFWLSHVPPERFEAFWDVVRSSLAPGGRVFFMDSAYTQTSTARDHTLDGPEATTMTRRLNDGREFRIVKIFYDPPTLQGRLAHLGWDVAVRPTANFFIYGQGGPVAGNLP